MTQPLTLALDASTYSGTVAAAMEGLLSNIPSIAISIGAFGADLDFGPAASFAALLARNILERGFAPDTLLNVNVPALARAEIAGVEVTRLGKRNYHDTLIERLDPYGNPYYWVGGPAVSAEAEEGTDVAALLDALDLRGVVLVGHSMGGLVARACLRDPRTRDRIAKIVTLGTPHHGSELARRAVGENGRQLRRGSAWLEALNGESSAPVPLVSIFSLHDNYVAPQGSAILPGADNMPLAGIGHLSMVFSDAVAQHVAQEVVGAAQK